MQYKSPLEDCKSPVSVMGGPEPSTPVLVVLRGCGPMGLHVPLWLFAVLVLPCVLSAPRELAWACASRYVSSYALRSAHAAQW